MPREETLADILTTAVQRCIPEDKVCAVQLSGGLDSAIIQAIAKCDRLYCCTWPEQDNMSEARLAAQMSRHDVKAVTFSKADMLEVLPVVAKLTDGKGTWSQVCQYFLGKAMAADGVEVVLNGEAADELFGGYSRYRILYWLEKMYTDPRLEDYGPTIQHMCGTRREALAVMLSRTVPLDVVGQQVKSAKWARGLVGAMASVEEKNGLVQLIELERRIAEHHGIEHRWPFKDATVVDFAHTMDVEEMVDGEHCKALLRRTARMLGVPEAIVEEKTKRGLFIPQSWRPDDARLWSRDWFTNLMAKAHEYGQA